MHASTSTRIHACGIACRDCHYWDLWWRCSCPPCKRARGLAAHVLLEQREAARPRVYNYHDQRLSFPVGQCNTIAAESTTRAWNRACWWQATLPYVEQGNLYDAMEAYMSNAAIPYVIFSVNNNGNNPSDPGRNTIVKSFICPSDGDGPKNKTVPGNEQGFHGNYVLCSGPTAFNPSGDPGGVLNRGMFYPLSDTKMASAVDGTSNTLFAGEILVGERHDRPRPTRPLLEHLAGERALQHAESTQ